MFRFTENGHHHAGVTLRELFSLLRPAKPLPAYMKTRQCLLHGCGNPALLTGFLCESHEIAEQISMYDPQTGWGQQ
jgi:hypothetical protein